MKRSFWKKFLRVKITVVALLFILAVAALQTPWFKNHIVEKISTELSTLTQSEVSVDSSEGFVPLSFNLYHINFMRNGKVWLSIENLSLNRSLLYFVFWKKKGIDLSIYQANLYSIPDYNPEEKLTQFSWPKSPHYTLNIKVNGQKFNIAESVFNQNLPSDLHFKMNFYLGRNGKVFSLKSFFESEALDQASLKFNIRGYQKQNIVHIDSELKDRSQTLKSFFKTLDLPPIEASVSLSGAPEAYLAFLQKDLHTNGLFRGSLKISAFPSNENSLLWKELLNDNNLQTSAEFYFDNMGLLIKHSHIRGSNITLSGSGGLSRQYDFKETYFEGMLDNLNFTKHWLNDPVEGKLGALVTLSGEYKNPKINLKLESEHLAYKHFIARQFQSDILIEKYSSQYVGDYHLTASLNQSSLESTGRYTYCELNHCDFEDVSIKYGANSLNVHSFKKIKDIYQSQLDLDFKQIAIFSPLIKKEIHGNMKGSAALDIDVSSKGLTQLAQIDVEGSIFQYSQFNLSSYSISSKGEINWNELKDYQGETNLSSEQSKTKNLDWDSLNIYLKTSPNNYDYKLQTNGDFSVLSSGHIEKQDQLWQANVRQFNGSVDGVRYNLIHPTTLEYQKCQINFTPLLVKVGDGQIYLNKDSKDDSAQIDLRKFPIESLTYFINGFDVRGVASMKGTVNQISSQSQGSMTAQFSNLRVEDYQERSPYTGRLELTLNKKNLEGNCYLSKNPKDFARAEIKLPVSLTLFPWKFDLDTGSSAKANITYKGKINPFLQLLIPPNHLVEGYASIDMQMSGSLKEPNIKGQADFCKSYYENLFLGLVLKDVDLKMVAKGKSLYLENLHAYDSENGQISASGKIGLSLKKHFPYQIDFNIQNSQILQFDFFSASLLGKGRFEGDFRKAYLQGKFDMTHAEINLPNSFGTTLPRLAVTYVYPRKEASCSATQRATRPLPVYFDVDLNVLNQTLIKGRGLNTSWAGDVVIRGSDLHPIFKGTLHNQEGTFDFAGRLFELQEGTINLDGRLSKDTSINLSAANQINQHKVFINLKGPLLTPHLSYRSEPSLNQKKVLSLVLFGQTDEELNPFQAVALTHTLASLGGVYRGPGAINKLRKGIGLDQLSLGSLAHDNKDYTTIQLGKYISRSILITLNRPITADPSPFVVTAQFRGGFQFQTYFDQSAISKLMLQWRFSY
ncbi:MAG: hypothetical protein S4CHLAM6_07990 [Chlamydiae bacterium]|nr:hypothetical protein [Chlamydiota bacterium]